MNTLNINHEKMSDTMTNNPKISVILPVYNGMPFLIKSIQSVLDQTFKNFELIIVNDGSTDDTEKYILSLQNEKIIYIKQENKKTPAALNTGLAKCRGEYITWTSHDNLYDKNAFSIMKNTLDSNPNCGFVYSNYKLFGDSNSFVSANLPSLKNILFNFKGMCSFMWRKSVSDKVGGFDVDLHYAEDLDYWIRIFEHNNNIILINKVLYSYQVHKNQVSNLLSHKRYDVETHLAKKLLIRNNNLINIYILYPSIKLCYNTNRAKSIAYYDLGLNIIKSKKQSFKNVFEQNLEIYFKLSFECDMTFTPSLINLIIVLKNKKLEYGKYSDHLINHKNNIYNINIMNINNNFVDINLNKEELFRKERKYLSKHIIL